MLLYKKGTKRNKKRPMETTVTLTKNDGNDDDDESDIEPIRNINSWLSR